MKIRVSFPIEVEVDDRALVRLARESQPSKIRDWIQAEAECQFIDFLEKNGITILGGDG